MHSTSRKTARRTLRLLLPALVAGACLVLTPVVGAAGGDTGSLSGTVDPVLRPSAGAVSKIRAINVVDGTAAAVASIGANGAFRLVLPPGVYLPVVEKVGARTPAVTGYGRLVRVRSGASATISTVKQGSAAKRHTASVGRWAGVSADTRVAAGAGRPAVAVKYFTGSGPYPFMGKGLAEMALTDLAARPCLTIVEWERRGEVLAEIRLQQSKFVDPSTRVTPHLIQPTVFVEGSVGTTTSSISWNIRAREIASGRVLASASGSGGANLFTAFEASMARFRKQLEEQLCVPTRFTGSFSGQTQVIGANTFNGSITFVRDPSRSKAGVAVYTVESVRFNVRISATTPCVMQAETNVTLTKPQASTLVLDTAKTPRGYRYAIAALFQSPTSVPIDASCNGVHSTIPWTPGAGLYTSSDQFSSDLRTLQGTYDSPPTQATYSWNLKGS
jgi:hypothetical protein